MCNNHSESGQSCGFEPCDAFKRMKSQYAATNLSLCEINKERRDDIERLEAENAALRQERDRLARIVHECMATLGMTQTAWEGTNIPRGEDDLPRWVRDVSQATYEKGVALEKADALAEKVQNLKWKMRENMLGDVLIRPGLFDAAVDAMVSYRESRHG